MFFERGMETMTSVGYGDTNTSTPSERIISIFFMFTTSGFIGYFVGKVDTAIQKSTQTSIFFRNLKKYISFYFAENNAPNDLKFRVLAYLRHLRQSYNENLLQEEDIINLLSTPLREQIFFCTKGHVLINLNFFSNLTRSCIRSLGYKMTLEIYGPLDVIFNQGELTTNLYFINLGSIQIFHRQSKTVYTELKKGDFFGEISFLLQKPRTASARSSNFSEILSLSRYEVDKVLKTMPNDKEKFFTIIRNLNTYGTSVIGLKCYLCGSLDHIACYCNLFIIRPNISENMLSLSKKLVNVDNTPGPNIRKEKSTALRYELQNTKGRKVNPKALYKTNPYLATKSMIYADSAYVTKKKMRKILTIVNPESCENSSNDSEKCFINFNYLNMKQESFENELLTFNSHQGYKSEFLNTNDIFFRSLEKNSFDYQKLSQKSFD